MHDQEIAAYRNARGHIIYSTTSSIEKVVCYYQTLGNSSTSTEMHVPHRIQKRSEEILKAFPSKLKE
ncbi:MAG TPA: hypothetical protein VEL11_19270 [Candidatus Bathyarchaeia archaeon]|nr:hypothetical protein [Candidatus Bathyarchaeia archaeon]